MENFVKAVRLAAVTSCIGMGIAGCAGTPAAQSDAKPGDYLLNRESAPLCQLYPGNYPQSAECMISPR
ncbi:MAG: hypothetical protein JWP36_441 [Paucimonas sp.]|nr:hypothetical protein [Paucimonas sp.]